MAGPVLNLAALREKANTAGHTYTQGEPNPGAPVAGTLTEAVRRLVPTASGALDSLFRQEPVAAPIASAEPAVPTTATRGPHGGLIPGSLSHIFAGSPAPSPSPGPQMGTPGPLEPGRGGYGEPSVLPVTFPGAVEDLKQTAADAKNRGGHWLATVRRRLGV